MLKLFRRAQVATPEAIRSAMDSNIDLQIRNLLDDPDLRRAMGLDPVDSSTTVTEPRRLDRAAA